MANMSAMKKFYRSRYSYRLFLGLGLLMASAAYSPAHGQNAPPVSDAKAAAAAAAATPLNCSQVVEAVQSVAAAATTEEGVAAKIQTASPLDSLKHCAASEAVFNAIAPHAKAHGIIIPDQAKAQTPGHATWLETFVKELLGTSQLATPPHPALRSKKQAFYVRDIAPEIYQRFVQAVAHTFQTHDPSAINTALADIEPKSEDYNVLKYHLAALGNGQTGHIDTSRIGRSLSIEDIQVHIRADMARLRRMPEIPQTGIVFYINIPTYQLQVFDGGRLEKNMLWLSAA